ncbi:MAG: HlyD family type I secretion periplasmic adaptor subunit [Phyllobacterium sp.]
MTVSTGYPSAEHAVRRLTIFALCVIFVLLFGIGGLAAMTVLSGAVVAPGTLVVDSHVKPVQHSKGGIVAAIQVANGDAVERGDVLVRVDSTEITASRAIVANRLDELAVRSMRLAAERDGNTAMIFPASLAARSGDQAIADLLSGEEHLFQARKASRNGKKAQLQERIQQLEQEIGGLAAQRTGKTREIELIGKELASLYKLSQKGLVPVDRVYALEREAARLSGELGNLTAMIAQSKGRIAETKLQIIQIDDDHMSEVAEDLRRTQAEAGEFSERLVAIENDLKQADIRAPQAGIVHHLAVYAPGAVIGPGDPILQVVPVADALVAEIRIAPQDIDQLEPGQKVSLLFPAFNQRTTPQINGTVARIAPDLTREQQAGLSYYLVRVTVSGEEWRRLGPVRPVSGMPVEAFVQTGARTVLSYLMKPLADQMARAFREE